MLVGIAGNKYFSTQTLRERMYLTPANLLQFRYGRYSSSYLKRDINAIKDLYESNGFRDVEVTASTQDDYKGADNDVAVFLTVTEGPQWFVSKLELEGVRKEYVEQIESMLRSIDGQPYSDLNIVNDQETVLNFYFNNGYPAATFESTITPSSEPNRMDVKFVVNEGQRQFVRDVLISGLKITDPDLVRKRIRNLDPGAPLSQSSMIDSQRRLYDLGIFARVDVALQNPEGDEDYKDVLYRIEEGRKYSISGGVGAQVGRIGTGPNVNFEPVGPPGFSPRVSLGISRSNFLGIGNTLSLLTRFSNIQRKGVFSYLAPQFKGNENLNLTFTGIYDDSRDIRTFNAKRQEGFAQLGQSSQRPIAFNTVLDTGTPPSIRTRCRSHPRSSRFCRNRSGSPSGRSPLPRTGAMTRATPAAAPTIRWTPPTRRTSSEQRLHSPACSAGIPPTIRMTRDIVLARSTSFGVQTRISSLRYPLPERFFAGGASSHRGFPDNQAGPRDLITGFPIGGNALLINNLEVRFPLIGDNIRGVVFHDAGNVYSQLGKISFRYNQRDMTDFDYMVHAVGFGIRYRTPIGPDPHRHGLRAEPAGIFRIQRHSRPVVWRSQAPCRA